MGDGRTGAVGMRTVGIGRRILQQCARTDRCRRRSGRWRPRWRRSPNVSRYPRSGEQREESGAAPACRWRVSQTADEYVVMCDGFEYGTERGIGRRHGEAKCSERSDRSSGVRCPRHQLRLPRAAGRKSTCVGHAYRGQGVRPRRTGYAGATDRTWRVWVQQRHQDWRRQRW